MKKLLVLFLGAICILGTACARQAPPLDRGITLFKEGKYDEARDIFYQNVKAGQKDLRAHAYLAGSLHYLKREQEALKYLAQAHKIDPNFIPVYDQLREIYANHWNKLIESQQKALNRDKKNHTALAWTAFGYMLKKDYPRAVEYYQTLNQAYPGDTLGRIFGSWARYKGGSKGRSGGPDETFEKDLQQIAAQQPGYFGTYFNLAGYYFEIGRLDEATEYVQKAIEQGKNYGGNYNLYGQTLHRQMALEEAEKQLRQAVAIDPLFTEAYLRLGNILATREKLDEAISYYQKVIQRQPANNTAYFLMGNAYLAKGQPEKAIPAYEKADSLKPGQSIVNYFLGTAYVMENNREKAVKYFKKAVKYEPETLYSIRAREELAKVLGVR